MSRIIAFRSGELGKYQLPVDVERRCVREIPCAREIFVPAPVFVDFLYSGQRLGGNFPVSRTGNSADPNRERPTPSRELTTRIAGTFPISIMAHHAMRLWQFWRRSRITTGSARAIRSRPVLQAPRPGSAVSGRIPWRRARYSTSG